ncbi:tryptophan halogenase [Sphingorhabdus lutea]|uniref:Tryptophan halogenase n=2 Tax=Sphingorhabdus lutea TaxID=1913578 RepID=A0A1L3JEK4_9SPHN|nr:tryptophan halogenase [Sphingorhabdus lutea]
MTPPKSIIILGGGTAGWMAANLLAHHWSDRGVKITLIDSADIGIIGVGEGSTPQLKAFFDILGVTERQWMPQCNATYKLGINFEGWSNRHGFDRYFHPFQSELDGQILPAFYYNALARRTARNVPAHPDLFFLPTKLARMGNGPIAKNGYPHQLSYGYHFDAHLVGQFLKKLALDRGVRHLDRKINSASLNTMGEIDAIIDEDGGEYRADFFIDCSGFRALLIQKSLNEKFISYGDMLFNDSAVVMPTLPAMAADKGPNNYTGARALSSGWLWNIPLTNRTGNGYVYSSHYQSDDKAEIEFRTEIGALEDKGHVRHLKMKVGRVENSWVKNCMALGLSQGFLEPLEATAIHIVLATMEKFIAQYNNPENTDIADAQAIFNEDIGRRYDGICDYIVAHYKLNQRHDTQYWRDNAQNQNLSPSLKQIITTWFTAGDLTREIGRQNISSYYSSLSWHCLFSGYGIFPMEDKMIPAGDDIRHYDMQEIENFLADHADNFPSHAELLGKL